MTIHETFLQAIHERKIVKLTFDSQEKGVIQRFCIPFDFGPSKRNLVPNPDRYHFYDLDSPEKSHNLSLLPDQIKNLEITDKTFEPSEYVHWTPNWFVARDWGNFS